MSFRTCYTIPCTRTQCPYPLLIAAAAYGGVALPVLLAVREISGVVKGQAPTSMRGIPWGKAAIMVELSKYPLDERWLRLWFNRFLFAPTGAGFVLLVEDWMGLSRQLDDFRSDWAMRRAERRRQRQSY